MCRNRASVSDARDRGLGRRRRAHRRPLQRALATRRSGRAPQTARRTSTAHLRSCTHAAAARAGAASSPPRPRSPCGGIELVISHAPCVRRHSCPRTKVTPRIPGAEARAARLGPAARALAGGRTPSCAARCLHTQHQRQCNVTERPEFHRQKAHPCRLRVCMMWRTPRARCCSSSAPPR